MQYDSGMASAPAVFLAILQYDPFNGEFWKNLPQIIAAAKNNPLGVVFGVVLVLSLAAIAASWNQPGRTRLAIFGLLFVASIIGIVYAGNSEVGKRAQSASMTGSVRDHKTSQPVPRAKVSLSTQGSADTIYTDSDGFWRRDGLHIPTGSHVKVYVAADRYQNYERDLSSEAAAQPVEIFLEPAETPKPPPPTRPGAVTLSGIVLTRDGAPVENAQVLLASDGTPPQQETAYTDSNGVFHLVHVQLRPDLDLKITVRAKGFRTKTENLSSSSVHRRIQLRLEPEAAN